MYVPAGIEMAMLIGTSGGLTVTFAIPSTDGLLLEATASTEYVAAVASVGICLDMEGEAEDAAEMVKELCENVVAHVPGTSDDKLKLRGAQDEVSLLVTPTVYVTLSRG